LEKRRKNEKKKKPKKTPKTLILVETLIHLGRYLGQAIIAITGKEHATTHLSLSLSSLLSSLAKFLSSRVCFPVFHFCNQIAIHLQICINISCLLLGRRRGFWVWVFSLFLGFVQISLYLQQEIRKL
jgi:hypothetical protein